MRFYKCHEIKTQPLLALMRHQPGRNACHCHILPLWGPPSLPFTSAHVTPWRHRILVLLWWFAPQTLSSWSLLIFCVICSSRMSPPNCCPISFADLEHENEIMRTKMENLQMLLEQKRLKRQKTSSHSCPNGLAPSHTSKEVYGRIQSQEVPSELTSEKESADVEPGTVVSWRWPLVILNLVFVGAALAVDFGGWPPEAGWLVGWAEYFVKPSGPHAFFGLCLHAQTQAFDWHVCGEVEWLTGNYVWYVEILCLNPAKKMSL